MTDGMGEGGDIMIIDTHEHCFSAGTMDCWAADRMPEFERKNIKFVECSINCFDIDDMIAVVTKYNPCLGVVVGEHPKLIAADTDIEKIFCYVKGKAALYKKDVLGIKTGLDYYRVEDETARIKQQELLRKFLLYAKKEDLPVVLHIRSSQDDPGRADLDLQSVLSDVGFSGRMVLHCFSGNEETVSRCLELNPNVFFGIGGAVTYPEYGELIKAVKIMPKKRILLETDGPYMKPFYPDLTRPAGKQNSSLNLPIVIDKLALVLKMEPDEIENLTAENAGGFYGLKADEKKIN